MIDSLSQSLDDTDIKIRSWNINGIGQTGMQLGAFILGAGILLGLGGGKFPLTLVGILGSLNGSLSIHIW